MEILFFLICPIAFVLSRVYLIDSFQQIISNICFIAVSFMISILVYIFLKKSYKQNGIMKPKIIVAIGVILDQLLKCLVYKFNIHFNIIGTAFRIRPTQNLNQTAMFNFLDINIDWVMVAVLKLVIVALIIFIFSRIPNKNFNYTCSFVLFLSAGISNLMDTLMWGYTLDYFLFEGFLCYDLKDFYVDIALGFVIIELIKMQKKEN